MRYCVKKENGGKVDSFPVVCAYYSNFFWYSHATAPSAAATTAIAKAHVKPMKIGMVSSMPCGKKPGLNGLLPMRYGNCKSSGTPSIPGS
jgi:hypothetical protein